MYLIGLTNLKGQAVYVNPTCVVRVRPPLAQEVSEGAAAIVEMLGYIQATKEAPEIITARIEDAQK